MLTELCLMLRKILKQDLDAAITLGISEEAY
jgi:hypothetical protein